MNFSFSSLPGSCYNPAMFNSTTIVLIGMPGSGKTTVGQLLAQLLDLRFHDSDALLAKSLGQPIAEIYAQKGEAYFRHNETLTCSTLLQHSEGVIALGGGAVLSPEVRSLLPLHTVLYLKASLPVLQERLGTDRPNLGDLQALEAERLPLYERLAKKTLLTDHLTPLAATRRIMEILEFTLEVC